MFDRKALLFVAGLELLGLCSAKELQFFKSNNLLAHNLDRRQTAPPGYHPEFGSCGSGTTCENACGPNWLSCSASTDLSLFCYNNVDFGQTCCENGSGRACDKGYYCAWQTFGGRVWCCEDGQSLEECGVSNGVTTRSSSTTTQTSTATDSSSTATGTDTTTNTKTTTTASGSSATGCGTQATVTSWATTTFFATVEVTKTVPIGGCSSDSTFTQPPDSTATDTTITKPPISSTTFGPITNTTATRSIVTAGAGRPGLNGLAFGFIALPFLW
ncbi:hypothetical protein QBC43DRAFT_319901 [Cladorrhinum sp. PSN259]|nr:hypothetical protein QBC43DRAFT_319901 [Cladorrhinum sp. PSN259]